MKISLTSSAANKRIKELEEEKQSLRNQESDAQFYSCGVNESIEVPTYNFMETTQKIDAIDTEIATLRHAINQFNVSTFLPETNITVDMALVKVAQLNKKADALRRIKDRPEKARSDARFSLGGASVITYRNYNAEEVRSEYKKTIEEIHKLQMTVDKLNLTVEFLVEV